MSDGEYVVGRHAIEEALRDGVPLERAWVSDEPSVRAWWGRTLDDRARAARVSVTFVPRSALDRMVSRGVVHQGVVARAAAVAPVELEDVLARTSPALLVLVDGIEDPRNLGAVIRSAAAAGSTGVLLPERRVAAVGAGAAKAAAGALARLPPCRVKNVQRALERLREANVWTVGLVPGARPIWDIDLIRPTCIVIGGEEKGLSRLARERCDDLAGIPMAPGAESLNASVAASIALFEAVRQRSGAS